MNTDEDYRIVDFEKYCKMCKYKDTDEVKDPCNECLDIPARQYTDKPEKYVDKK